MGFMRIRNKVVRARLGCDVVGVMKSFLSLCETQGTCTQGHIDWAKDNIDGLIRKNYCPDQKVVFRP